MKILLTGTSGYVGSRLAPRLLAAGHEVRGFSRRGLGPPGIRTFTGDAVTGAGLADALGGVDVAYYLIHSMEPSTDGVFGERERRSAASFAEAAGDAGVARIVYLGGLLPARGPASPHLSSRMAVEGILRGAVPDTVVLRASIVIGAGSRSFRFLVRLIERLRVLAVPAWHRHRTAPIDERDVVELLARAGESELAAGETFDIGGPDVVSYGELIDRIRDHMLVDRATLSFKRLSATPIASRVAAVVAGESYELIGPLMESLDEDLIPRDRRGAELLDVREHSLDSAIEHALREWEAHEPLAAR
ncbi:MAG TPA: NAD-dependent epimerase/dehydratase family protein [Solirubrobacteraceae bacterium]|nr:NAD-dependent epimerase/dehydratase family protein [Solirubrobacteraceae bacterium]